MLVSFKYSVNCVGPIFLLVLIGWCFQKLKFIPRPFFEGADKLVFKVALPAELFFSIYCSDYSELFGEKTLALIAYCVGGVTICFIALCIFVPFFVKENDKRGAFIQGAFRSNYALFALPLAFNMFGEAGRQQAAIIMPATVILYNIYTVITFVIFAPKDTKQTFTQVSKKIIISIIKNPLIIGIVAGLILVFIKARFKIYLPVVLSSTLEDIAGLAIPLALLSIGATFRTDALKGRIHYAAASASIKIIIMPIIAVVIAAIIGYRGIQLASVLILFGGPTSVSSYIMAKNMKSDYELASQILIITTLFSLLTMFAFIFILKQLGLI